MGLKTFHLIFVALAVLLAAGVGFWRWKEWQADPAPLNLAYILLAALVALGLAAYGFAFQRKARRLNLK